MLRILPSPWYFKMSASSVLCEPDVTAEDLRHGERHRDKYEPIRRLSMVQIQPPRNPDKPFTSFGIKDILGSNGRTNVVSHKRSHSNTRHRNINSLHSNSNHRNFRPEPVTRIVRPWDSSPAPGRHSENSSDADDEEINVEDDDDDDRPLAASALKDVSPLDALMEMANKTFQGLETSEAADAKRREQAALFGKHQTPKKRRKSRTAFTNQQIYELEKRFLYQKYLTPADRDEIAQHLGLTNAQVITWFQNRRAKLKRDLEELKNDVVATKKLASSVASEGDCANDSDFNDQSPSKRCRSESGSPEPRSYETRTEPREPTPVVVHCDDVGDHT